MSQTVVVFESKYGLSEAIARDIGRILGPARVCRARELGDLGAPSAGAAPAGVAPATACDAVVREASFVVIVTPVYRHAPDEHIMEFARASREWLCARHVVLVCVGLATSPGAVSSYLAPLKEILGDCVAWTGGLGGRVAMNWLDEADRADIEHAAEMRNHRGLAQMDAYSAEAVAEAALAIKAVRDSFADAAPADEVRRRLDDFLAAHNTCTLCTGAGEHVRATPIEYVYRDGELYLLSEGGEKFAHLMVNAHVSVAVYDPYRDMDTLAGLQLMGRVELVPEGSEQFAAALRWRGIDQADMAAQPFSLNLLRVHIDRAEFVWSGFKGLGYDRHQVYEFPPAG
jgi:uncharacterized protein YhbP (UPF0306 family)/NAD(P)H-dependent FMN reductase